MEISSRYAWLYKVLPACLKWAGMAAIASHHVRLALFPLRLDADRTGYVDIPHSLGRRRLLLRDVHTIRTTNNAIFNDIFWVHIAYVTADDGINASAPSSGSPDYGRSSPASRPSTRAVGSWTNERPWPRTTGGH